MIIRFTLDETAYDLDLRKVLNVEAIAAQKVTGAASWDAILASVDEGDATAITALVWVRLKRDNPELRFSDVEFSLYDWRSREFIDPDAPAEDGDAADVVDPPETPDGSESN